jgi:pyruvate ferredoxin oxidoreductase gamma subunit
MLEVIIHGRGGQGAVTFSQLVAIASFYEGKYSQAFPVFGIERRGAPAAAFVRIDDKPILLRQQIYEADIIVVLDPTLLCELDIKSTLKKKGSLMINSHKSADEIKKQFNLQGYDIFTFDATSLALQVFKKNIVNTVMFAVFAANSKLIHLNSAYQAVEERFHGNKESLILNKKIIGEVYSLLKK